jgi:hypothetical protein
MAIALGQLPSAGTTVVLLLSKKDSFAGLFCGSHMLLPVVGLFLLLALPASADAGGAALLARRLCCVLSPIPVLLRE